ncbi:hypothetical protein O7A70_31120 [Mesorhizobium sp. Cs1299R1N1]|uniref:hypothetical protein n=1 Tax=unclassified Mesorhizobium TaxID=325217 RepID=UPI00301CD418
MLISHSTIGSSLVVPVFALKRVDAIPTGMFAAQASRSIDDRLGIFLAHNASPPNAPDAFAQIGKTNQLDTMD